MLSSDGVWKAITGFEGLSSRSKTYWRALAPKSTTGMLTQWASEDALNLAQLGFRFSDCAIG